MKAAPHTAQQLGMLSLAPTRKKNQECRIPQRIRQPEREREGWRGGGGGGGCVEAVGETTEDKADEFPLTPRFHVREGRASWHGGEGGGVEEEGE